MVQYIQHHANLLDALTAREELMSTWVTNNAATLRLISYILGAVSLVFGGTVLGRFPALKRRGGFFSSILVAIPSTILYAVTIYVSNELYGNLWVRTLSDALQVSIDPYQYAGALAVLAIGIPLMTQSYAFRPKTYTANARLRHQIEQELKANPDVEVGTFVQRINQLRAQTREDMGVYPVEHFTGMIIFQIALLVEYVFGMILTAQYLIVVKGWFGGALPAIQALVIASILGWLPFVIMQWQEGVKMFHKISVDDLDEDDDSNRMTALGCVGNLIQVVLAIISVALGVFCLIALVLIGVQVGWVLPAMIGVSLLCFGLVMAIRAIADRLNSKALTSIFAFPGAVAAVIQFVVNNPGMLPH